MTKKPKMVCCICRGPIGVEVLTGWDGGHNAEPIMFGRCCRDCNDMVVFPTRMRRAGISSRSPLSTRTGQQGRR